MEDTGLLLQIQGMLPALPEQERRLGEFVLQYPNEAPDETIVGLARRAGVSTTTVSRFCRRLGLDGFRQFKVALAREWSRPSTLIYVQSQPGDTLATLTGKILAANILALQDIQRSLDLDILEQVVDVMLRARRVDIYATGGASITARELHFKCMQLGLNANAFLDSQMQVMSAASLSGNDLGFGISHSGMQRHVVAALGEARAGGAFTVAMTSYPRSPLAQAADLVLVTASLGSPIAYTSPSVRTAQLAVVDVLYEAMLIKGRESAQVKMARVAQAISEHMSGRRSKP